MFETMEIFSTFVFIHFFLAVFLGGYFGSNLIIAVLKMNYSNSNKNISEIELQEEEELANQGESI